MKSLPLTRSRKVDLSFWELGNDLLQLFTGTKHGHLTKWEYMPPTYDGDPAGGEAHWKNLVLYPGAYYLPEADKTLIQEARTGSILEKELEKVEHFLEFGPGCLKSIREKSIPLLFQSQSPLSYTAVDYCPNQARLAANEVRRISKVKTYAICHDFLSTRFDPYEGKSPRAYMLLGGTIGNLSGKKNSTPQNSLVKVLTLFAASLKEGDRLIITFDTEQDKNRILYAYNEPSNRSGILSPLYLANGMGIIHGTFDPRAWCYEPVWYPDVMQCAHTLFPVIDQTIIIGDQTIQIPAWTRFVSNNSYKFRPEAMRAAAAQAGLQSQIVQHGPMAMLIAEK